MGPTFQESIKFWLCDDEAYDKKCMCGYDQKPTKNKYPSFNEQGNGAMGPVRPLRDLPESLKTLKAESAIYRLQVNGVEHPEVYIGKATSLRSRMADYVEMTRRVLALRFRFKVYSDKHGLRYVHYWVARALSENEKVNLSWYYYPMEQSNGHTLARQEQLEIAKTICEYDNKGCYSHVKNGMESFKSSIHESTLEECWKDVWKDVQKKR